jgi:hypothetical protein
MYDLLKHYKPLKCICLPAQTYIRIYPFERPFCVQLPFYTKCNSTSRRNFGTSFIRKATEITATNTNISVNFYVNKYLKSGIVVHKNSNHYKKSGI